MVVSLVIVLKDLVYKFADEESEDCGTGNGELVLASIELFICVGRGVLAFHSSKGRNWMLVCTFGGMYVKLY
jgi:hypothetical protein